MENAVDMKKVFSNNLKKARREAGYRSAKEFQMLFSDKIKLTTYVGYENKGVWPPPENLILIADILGVTIDSLLGRNGKSEIEKTIYTLKANGFYITDIPEQKMVCIGKPFLLRKTNKRTGKRITKAEKEEVLGFYEKFPDFSELFVPYDEIISAVTEANKETERAKFFSDRFAKNKENEKRCFQGFVAHFIAKPRLEQLEKERNEFLLQHKPLSEDYPTRIRTTYFWANFVANDIELHKIPIPDPEFYDNYLE